MWCGTTDPRKLTRWIQWRLVVAGTLINGTAAFTVATYLLIIFPSEDEGTYVTPVSGLIATGVYVAFASLVASRRSRRMWRRIREWLITGEEPTAKQRRQLLRLPKRLALQSFALWILAAALFGVPSMIDVSAGFGVEVIGSTALAGMTTAAAVFLSAERILRPAVALALDAEASPDTRSLGIGPRMLLTWLLCSGLPLIMVALIPIGREENSAGDLVLPVLFVAGIGFVVGLFATKLATAAVTRPVRSMRRAVDKVRDGDLDVAVEVDDGSELGRLQAGFNAMVAGLREREQLHDLFGRQVGLDVAREALERQPSLGGQTQNVSALFVDVIGSTAIAERETPERVVALLNSFFEIVVSVVDEHGGFVNKFEGDAALCVFGAPIEQADHAARALSAARAIRARLDAAEDALDAAIGVACGDAVAGYVGAESRFEYTVIGDPVNEASRLTELAKQRPQRLLASAETVSCAGDEESAFWEVDGEVTLRGRTTPTRLAVPRAVEPPRAPDEGLGLATPWSTPSRPSPAPSATG
ncbi:MAG TPA: adenylate/guanylate cyclase domain-containing protein [Solirubrobacteraceae bacterium]|nr:adenylate/guanylate cyclase domain-containing protein [Solirubrobacteraceae bacterium]